MQVYTSLKEFSPIKDAVLTLGNFDGVHLGHQSLLHRVTSYNQPSIVLTFSNHPKEVLLQKKELLLCTSFQKTQLLAKESIDHVIILPFTREIADQPYDVFLQKLQEATGFTILILGKGSTLGKNRQGIESNIHDLSSRLHFTTEYVEKKRIDRQPLSTSWIKQALLQKNLPLVERALGRPYSLYLRNAQEIETLFLPPSGTYRGYVNKEIQEFTINHRELSLPPLYPLEVIFIS